MSDENKPYVIASPSSFSLAPQLVVIIVCLFILAGALILTPADSEALCVRLGRFPIPHTCSFRNITGLPCPGCGLTRSMVAAMHGDAAMSFVHHRLGMLTLIYIFLQFLYRLGLIVNPEWWIRIFGSGKFLNQGIIVLGILFILNWIFTFLF